MKPLPERGLLLLLAAVQFIHITDFMILMPLGPQLMRELDLGPGRFSALVSSYTLAAGLAGLAIFSLAVPPAQRGAFLSLSACTRDVASGLVSTLGGVVVSQSSDGTLRHYSVLGWIAVGFGPVSLALAAQVRDQDRHPHHRYPGHGHPPSSPSEERLPDRGTAL